jgi:hypothetical protein
MGMFSKPKAPDYAKIQEEARLKEQARIKDEEAKARQGQQEAMAVAESRRRAFAQSFVANTEEDDANKKFLKAK